MLILRILGVGALFCLAIRAEMPSRSSPSGSASSLGSERSATPSMLSIESQKVLLQSRALFLDNKICFNVGVPDADPMTVVCPQGSTSNETNLMIRAWAQQVANATENGTTPPNTNPSDCTCGTTSIPKQKKCGCAMEDFQKDISALAALVDWLREALKKEGYWINYGYCAQLGTNKCHDLVNRMNELIQGTGAAPDSSLPPKPSTSFKCIKIEVATVIGSVDCHVYHIAVCKNSTEIVAHWDFWGWSTGNCLIQGPPSSPPSDTNPPVGKF